MFKYYRFIDEWKLLDKIVGRDGGDTCHREGLFWTLLGMMSPENRKKWLDRFLRDPDDYWEMMKKLHVDPGIFIRHCRQLNDVNAWDRMSRDQFQTQISAAGYWSQKQVGHICRGHRRRWFLRTTNTRKNGATRYNHQFGSKDGYAPRSPDFTGPEIWGSLIRAGKKWVLRPLLYLFDLETFFGAIIWRYRWHNQHKKKKNITLNHTIAVMFAWHRYPTFWIRLAIWIMPFPKLLLLMRGHLTDFHKTDDMKFLVNMYCDAIRGIRDGHKFT